MKAAEIVQMLAADPLGVARAVLGDPSSTARDEARWGRKGSLALTLTGDRAGLWCSHETGEGGDLLDLIKHGLGVDTRAALAWAKDYLGGSKDPVFTCSRPKGGEQVNKRPKPLPCNEKTCSPAGEQKHIMVNKVHAALEVWKSAVPARGTLAEAYLIKRGLVLPADVDGRAVRFTEATAFRAGDEVVRLPALVALMRDPASGEPCGVQRTPLTPQGTKHPLGRRMRGRAGAVMASDDDEVTTGLFIVEGLEDALAALAFGYAPTWAAMSAGAIERFPVLAGVECLTIIADGDEAGVSAAQACAARWRRAGREVRVKRVRGGDLAELAGRIEDAA